MTFEEYVDQEFQKNLELAREEVQLDPNNNDIEDLERRAWRFAVEWTQDDIVNYVGRYLGQERDMWEEFINKGFYE